MEWNRNQNIGSASNYAFKKGYSVLKSQAKSKKQFFTRMSEVDTEVS